jgi:hypothetical protein
MNKGYLHLRGLSCHELSLSRNWIHDIMFMTDCLIYIFSHQSQNFILLAKLIYFSFGSFWNYDLI